MGLEEACLDASEGISLGRFDSLLRLLDECLGEESKRQRHTPPSRTVEPSNVSKQSLSPQCLFSPPTNCFDDRVGQVRELPRLNEAESVYAANGHSLVRVSSGESTSRWVCE